MLKSTPLDTIFIIDTRFILLHAGKSEFQLKNSQETADTIIISETRINIYSEKYSLCSHYI